MLSIFNCAFTTSLSFILSYPYLIRSWCVWENINAAHVISKFYKEVMFGIMKQVNQTNVQSKLLNHCFILVLEILLLFQTLPRIILSYDWFIKYNPSWDKPKILQYMQSTSNNNFGDVNWWQYEKYKKLVICC